MRKKVGFYFALVCLLSAFQCDEEYKPDEVVENLSLIEIEDNKSTFSVGDYFTITTTINNQQITKNGKTINVRDYMSTDQLGLDYSLEINRIGLNGEEIPVFVTTTEEIQGEIFIQDQSPFFNIISPYNETSASFSSKIGIKLTELGSYVLKTSIIKDNLYIVAFDTQSPLGSLQLTTNISNSDEEGIYRFTVE